MPPLTGTIAPTIPGTVTHKSWSDIPAEPLTPLIDRQFVVCEQVMLARLFLRKGAVVPEHSHPNEQVTYIESGALAFDIDGRTRVIRAGEVLTIPPNIPHRAEALEDTIDIDVFTPPRADWISGDDSYLRGK